MKKLAVWLKGLLTNNIGWKVVSLLASIILWAAVTTTNNPVVSQSYYNIPVQLLNTDSITGIGRVYSIENDGGVINKVTIRAPHSVINDIDSEDIIAVADVNELSSLDTVSVRFKTTKYDDQINSIVGSTDTIKLNIENKKTKSVALSTVINGTVAEGYSVGTISPDQNTIRVSGPESLVNQVAVAQVEIDVSGFSSDISTNAEVKLCDAQGAVVTGENLTQNIRTTGVKISLFANKEIPIVFAYTGVPYQGYAATGVITSDINTINVSGSPAKLKELEKIEIPAEAVDITDRKSDYSVLIDVTKYLPEEVYAADENSKGMVTVMIEAQTNKRLNISENDIKAVNIPDGYKATIFAEDGTILELIGLSTDLDMVNKDNLNPIVDIADWMRKQGTETVEDGFYSMPVSFNLSDKITVLDVVNVTVHLEKNKEEE